MRDSIGSEAKGFPVNQHDQAKGNDQIIVMVRPSSQRSDIRSTAKVVEEAFHIIRISWIINMHILGVSFSFGRAYVFSLTQTTHQHTPDACHSGVIIARKQRDKFVDWALLCQQEPCAKRYHNSCCSHYPFTKFSRCSTFKQTK